MSPRALSFFAALPLAALAAYFLLRDEGAARAEASPASVSATDEPAPEPAARPSPSSTETKPKPKPKTESPEDARRRALIDQKRAQIRELIEARKHGLPKGEAAPDAEPATTTDSAPVPPPAIRGELDKQYIQDGVREIIPVIRECYNEALALDEALAGRMVLSFQILGDQEVGGVVDQVEVDERESSLADPHMRECVRQSLYMVELPPPEDGGIISVTYPFNFEPG